MYVAVNSEDSCNMMNIVFKKHAIIFTELPKMVGYIPACTTLYQLN